MLNDLEMENVAKVQQCNEDKWTRIFHNHSSKIASDDQNLKAGLPLKWSVFWLTSQPYEVKQDESSRKKKEKASKMQERSKE